MGNVSYIIYGESQYIHSMFSTPPPKIAPFMG